MCGLSAIVDFGSGGGMLHELLSMHGRIAHRGPDGEGFCLVDGRWRCHDLAAARGGAVPEPRVGLAFRWLQIQDASPAAAQPMASADGAVRLLFNGEIYNFLALRAELGSLGHSFRSASDTEVVLAAYLQWGLRMFEKLQGMWAIVLLDLAAKRLVTSRDPFGIKPIFYSFDGSRLHIASEVKQLLAAGVPAQANLAAVKRFIRGGRPGTPEQTFFSSIHAQPAATYWEVDLQAAPAAPEFKTYWRLGARSRDEREEATLAASCERLDELLTGSVADHMISMAPVGILVSGGLDSSIVAALSKNSFAGQGKTGVGFSMVTGGTGDRERPHIERIVSELGFRSFTTELRPDWLKSRMGDITLAQEEPVAGIAAAGQYLTFQLVAAHGVKVALDGQGADELLGGYPRHQVAYLSDCLRRGNWGYLAAEAAALLVRDRGALHAAWGSVVRRGASHESADFIRDEEPPATMPRLSLDETLRKDVLTGNLRAVLALTDRNAMAHSVEARVPYVYRSIVEFAFTLPDRHKVGAGLRKRVLRRMAAGHVPAQIIERRDRVGFGAPVRQWLRQAFEAELRALPEGPAYRDSIAIDRSRLKGYVEGFIAGDHGDAGTIWRLYAVDQWARAYSVTGI